MKQLLTAQRALGDFGGCGLPHRDG